ncbi:MAG: SdrD B-like domain-containing protein, partial [Bacteroidota bacterium]
LCSIYMENPYSASGCAKISTYPTNPYGGQVETMWAKFENGYIYPLTQWSTSTSLSFCPTESGYYRMCARRVGCRYIIESEDTYVEPCGNIELDQYIQIDRGNYQSKTSINVCEGQDVVLDFEGSDFNDWAFVYTLPDGTEVTQSGYSDADQLLLSDIEVNQSGTYTVSYSDDKKCEAFASFTITVKALPYAIVSSSHASCSGDDGSISFTFSDRADRTKIEFSLDGGLTYPYNVKDNMGSTTITDLAIGEYDIFVRWGNDECPVDLPDATISNDGACASIGDFVFDDNNLNGVFDEGEMGVANIVVRLFEVGNNTAIDMDVTNAKGAYIFLHVEPKKSYFLEFSNLPPNYQFTTQSEGNNTDLDSDVDPTTAKTFIITPNPGTENTHIDAGILNTLNFPVEWLEFEAKQSGSDALLHWSTATELNSASFEIERSIDGVFFEPIGSTLAAGTSLKEQAYTYVDKGVRSLGYNKLSYRIRQMDIDGSFEYSKVLELILTEENSFDMHIYPNPTSDILNVSWTGSEGIQHLEIRNAMGQLVYKEDLKKVAGIHSQQLQIDSWTPGNYFIQISSEYHRETRSIIVN